ncbi:MarR family winged helix-turn-helix transcriptional regulator [Limnobacter sp. 130]|uniref:MarR family winged helix-turn-helix transcriptional regulator n=1 Tax=Limnobacter sp. 130 TaxID=2653147 RepID=UPI001F275FAB|nr:MarR family transcriptional regulator [Limnobacter sp. 130]
MYATSLAITQVYKPLLQPLGLTFPQYLVMMILWKEDGVSLINVARQLGQQPGALTPVIKRMAEQGLLTRNRSADDERQLQIYLTEEGKQIREKALNVYACVVDQCGMTPTEIHRLKCELDALRERLLKA